MGPHKLPGTPAHYLDVYRDDISDRSQSLERLEISGEYYVRYARYISINPNDVEFNRGAYLAAGFVTGRRLAVHEAANCIGLTSEIYGRLKAHIDAYDRVDSSFRLRDFAYDNGSIGERVNERSSYLLALDMLLQSVHGKGVFSRTESNQVWLDRLDISEPDELRANLQFFNEGGPDAPLRLDGDREKLQNLSQRLLESASLADRVQDEWLAYQAMMHEHLPSMLERGTELRGVLDDIERLTESLDSLRDEPAGSSAAAELHEPETVHTQGRYGPQPNVTQKAKVYGSRSPRASAGKSRSRASRGRKQPDTVDKIAKNFVISVTAVSLIVLAALGIDRIFDRDTAGDAQIEPETSDASIVPERGESETTIDPNEGETEPVDDNEGEAAPAGGGQSDVARERAALDTQPSE